MGTRGARLWVVALVAFGACGRESESFDQCATSDLITVAGAQMPERSWRNRIRLDIDLG